MFKSKPMRRGQRWLNVYSLHSWRPGSCCNSVFLRWSPPLSMSVKNKIKFDLFYPQHKFLQVSFFGNNMYLTLQLTTVHHSKNLNVIYLHDSRLNPIHFSTVRQLTSDRYSITMETMSAFIFVNVVLSMHGKAAYSFRIIYNCITLMAMKTDIKVHLD